MAKYTTTQIMSEVSKILRAMDPEGEYGLLFLIGDEKSAELFTSNNVKSTVQLLYTTLLPEHGQHLPEPVNEGLTQLRAVLLQNSIKEFLSMNPQYKKIDS